MSSHHACFVPSRRRFLQQLSFVAAASVWSRGFPANDAGQKLHLSSNQYTWTVYFARDGRDFGADLEASLQAIAEAGLDGLEPSGSAPAAVTRMGEGLRGQQLEMRSLYVNSTLHESDEADKSIQEILAIAKAARAAGTRIIVTNPNPIQWGGEQNKTDAQLETQARAMNSLGAQLTDLGLKLAYHNHDIELRHAAREFHHMMVGTDPRFVHLCLDAHWVYRGSGNSAVALFDIVELYGKRVVELHVRQSHDGVWSEVFTAQDDIDYARLVAALVRQDVRPLVVLEQAVEKGTPKTLDAVEALRRSANEARRVFAPLAG
jgi:inosose dehydratase